MTVEVVSVVTPGAVCDPSPYPRLGSVTELPLEPGDVGSRDPWVGQGPVPYRSVEGVVLPPE